MSAVPATGWGQVPLGEVVTLHYGKALDKSDRNPDGSVPVYGANGVKDRSDKWLARGPSLIVGRKGSAGEITREDGLFWPLDVSYYTSHDSSRLDFDFLQYALRTLDLPSLARGVKPGINRNDVYALPIALPKLEEQKRIVAVLDQAFAALDRARAHAEANLSDAMELKNCCVASELSSNVLGELESVGPHVNLLTGFAFKSGGYTEDPEDIRLVRGDNIVQGEFRWDGVKRWPVSDRANYEKYELARDDVLIAMDRTWISAGIKYAIVDEAALPSLLVQRVARLRSKPSLLPRYLAYWIGSKFFERYVLSIQTGLGVPHVSGSQIENFSIRVPSISEQEAVLDRLDRIMERQDSLVSRIQKKARRPRQPPPIPPAKSLLRRADMKRTRKISPGSSAGAHPVRESTLRRGVPFAHRVRSCKMPGYSNVP